MYSDKLSFVQIKNQLPNFDPEYPSAIHVTEDKVFMSYGKLRHLLGDQTGCTECVTIQRNYLPRKKAREKTPDYLNCARHNAHRTLQQIIEAPLSNKLHPDQPWILLGHELGHL
jgi:hypothetical protein